MKFDDLSEFAQLVVCAAIDNKSDKWLSGILTNKPTEITLLLNGHEIDVSVAFAAIEEQLGRMIQERAGELIATKFEGLESMVDEMRDQLAEFRNRWLHTVDPGYDERQGE